MDHHPDAPPADPLAELFPGPAHLGRPRRRAARRVVAGGAAVALLAFGGAAVAGAGGDAKGGYRTATAASHQVAEVLDRVGTLEPVSQASVAFPVSGTVSRVDVKVGDTVLVGQELAQLDTAELTRTLHEREAALAQAELVLQKALDGEDVSGLAGAGAGGGASGGSGGAPGPTATGISWDTSDSSAANVRLVAMPTASTTSTTPSTTSTSTPSASTSSTTPAEPSPGVPSTGGTDAALRAAQQAVLDAQQAVDRDLAAAQAALDRATEICAAVGTPTAPPAAGDPTTTTTSTPPSTDPSGGSAGSGVEACRTALAAVLDAQGQVAADQAALADASRALDDLLAERAASGSSGGSGGSGGTPSIGNGSLPGTSTGAGAGATGAATTVDTASAEALVAYQKAVDAAAAQVAAAEQAVDQARIVSPIGGTVVAVGLAVGDDVSAGSDTATVVISGAGGYEVTTHVSVDDVPDLEVGQAATVAPDGTDRKVAGEVVRIGAADSSSGSTTYPVTIGLTGDTEGLGNGSVASVSITTDSATRALAVPVSAVTVDGDRRTVTILEDGEPRTVTVEVGAVGQRWVEITSGLDAGDEVVLADLDQALPSSATESQQQSDTGAVRFGPGAGGGGFTPPAGFTGGPPRGN